MSPTNPNRPTGSKSTPSAISDRLWAQIQKPAARPIIKPRPEGVVYVKAQLLPCRATS